MVDGHGPLSVASTPSDHRSRAHFSGSGPGARTRDGCSVALYERSPDLDDLIDAGLDLSPGLRVLELGCGTGRLTQPMLAAGAEVTAVDNSADMLRAVPTRATTVLADIESLALDRTFDIVLLASGLINHRDAHVRHAFVACARRHLDVGGRFVIQRQDPLWLRDATVGQSGTQGAIGMHVEAVARAGPEVTMTLRFVLNDDAKDVPGHDAKKTRHEVWRQSFTIVSLSETDVEALLSEVGFGSFAWQGAKRRWVHAIAGSPR